MSQADLFKNPRFNGPDYDPSHDDVRLTGQLERVFNLMKDGQWRSLSTIALSTGDHEASISAQLRHLRKPRFGGHMILKKNVGNRSCGLWEYRLLLNRSMKKDV